METFKKTSNIKHQASSIYKVSTRIISALFVLCFLNIFSTGVEASRYIMSPSTAALVEGCDNTIDIKIDTEGQSTNAADVIIHYDPTKITILDSDATLAGIQIKPGNIYQAYFGNQVDTGTGEIRLTGASFMGSFTGVGTFGSIEFKGNAGVTTADFTIEFTGAGPYVSLDSNIADTLTSNDLLSGVLNGSYTFTTGFCFADVQAPNVIFLTPTNGQTGVATSAGLSIRVTDNQSGTDIQSVEVVLNGVTQTSNSVGFSYSGVPLNYSFVITPTNPILASVTNVLLVRARDFAGNQRTSTITFNTPVVVPPDPPVPDNVSPIITFISPVDKGTLPLNADLTFDLADVDSGININSLNVVLNGTEYTETSVQIVYSGTDKLYHVTLNPDANLPDATSFFVVYIEDKEGNGLVKSITFNIKQTVPGEIVPPTQCPPGETIVQVVHETGLPFIVALNPILSSTSENMLQVASSFSPLASLLGSVLLFGTQLWQIPYLLLQWFLSFLHWIGLKTKGRPYGYVYDAVSKDALSLSIVRIFDTTGKLIHTDVTDIYGMFNAKLREGTYFINVTRPEYKYPSKIVPGDVDYPYNRVYHGERFTVDEEQEITLSIPLDPVNAEAIHKNIERFRGFFSSLIRWTVPILMGVGIIVALYLLFRYPNIANLLILLLYIPTVYFYIKSLKTNNVKYGVAKTMDGVILKNLEIGLINSEFDKLVAKRMTDSKGLYRFLVEPGKYKFQSLNQDFLFVGPQKTYQLPMGADRNQPMIIADNITVTRHSK
jgi:hypothetical protein